MIGTTVAVIAALLLGLVIVAAGIGLYEVWVLRHAEDVDPEPRTRAVTVTLTADLSASNEALQHAARASRRLGSILERQFSGMMVKAYVQGGLADLTEHADPVAFNAHVRNLAMLSPQLAVEFIRGYAAHHDQPRQPFTFVGMIGDTRVTVLA